ncbi:periodic tryptophan protein 2 homolog [Tubulanus polymorphus]|uniref:periodic tryptophan protein 2 homolog n=1 Tax=Tubulanus polymorphus TaxID=672921 RepID=UPI003DA2336A
MTTATSYHLNPKNVPTRSLGAGAADFDLDGGGEEVKVSKGPFVEGQIKVLQIIECPMEIMTCRYHKDGSILAVGFLDGSIKIYDSDSGKDIYHLIDDEVKNSRLPVTSIRFQPLSEEQPSPTNILVATYASGLVKFWHYSSQKCMFTLTEKRQTLTQAFNPEGDRFITAGASMEIPIYDTKTKQCIRICQPSDSRNIMNGHRSRIFAVQYHPNISGLFISGGWDDTIQFWDEREQHSIRKISGVNGPHICGDAMDIDPFHGHILTGSWRKDNTLQIWDFASGDKVKDVPQDTLQRCQLYCAQWLGRDMIACAGSDNNIVRIIDRGTLNTIGQLVDLPQGVYCMDNTRANNNPKVACGSKNSIYIVRQDKI